MMTLSPSRVPEVDCDGEGCGQEALAKACRVHQALIASPTLLASAPSKISRSAVQFLSKALSDRGEIKLSWDAIFFL